MPSGNAEHVLRDWAFKMGLEHKLRPADVLLLLLMTRWADNETGELDPANATIAQQARTSDKWVREGRKRLAEAGVIEILDDAGGLQQGVRVRIIDYAERYAIAATNSTQRIARERDDARRRASTSRRLHGASSRGGPSKERGGRRGRGVQNRRGAPSGSRTTTPTTTEEVKIRRKVPSTTSGAPQVTPRAIAPRRDRRTRASVFEKAILDIVEKTPGVRPTQVRNKLRTHDDERVRIRAVDLDRVSKSIDKLVRQESVYLDTAGRLVRVRDDDESV